MPSGYRHLTPHDRCQIQALKKSGLSQRAIAAETGRSQSTVSREISRNSGQRGQANDLAVARRRAASSVPRRMTPAHWRAVEEYPGLRWSPSQTSGLLAVGGRVRVSATWIYRRIWADRAAGGDLYWAASSASALSDGNCCRVRSNASREMTESSSPFHSSKTHSQQCYSERPGAESVWSAGWRPGRSATPNGRCPVWNGGPGSSATDWPAPTKAPIPSNRRREPVVCTQTRSPTCSALLKSERSVNVPAARVPLLDVPNCRTDCGRQISQCSLRASRPQENPPY